MAMSSVLPIRDRLKNWARWVDWCVRRDLWGRGTDCMTGLICDRLRRAALGDVWSGVQMPSDIDERDAELIERAGRVQPP